MSTVGDIMSTVGDTQYRGVLCTPTVLNVPHGTQDNPHGTHDIPTVVKVSLHGTEHPHGTQDIPHGTHDIPTVLNTPTVLSTPHGTAHTLYRVVYFYDSPISPVAKLQKFKGGP